MTDRQIPPPPPPPGHQGPYTPPPAPQGFTYSRADHEGPSIGARFINVEASYVEVPTEDDWIESLPPRARRAYLEMATNPDAHLTPVGLKPWRALPRWKRLAWWSAMPLALTFGLVGFIAGLVLIVLFPPIGFFLMFGGIAPLGTLLAIRITHSKDGHNEDRH